MALTSRVIVTLSLTRTPPASRAAFQVRPKSLRLIVVAPVEADALVAEGVGGQALELDGELDGTGGATNGEVAHHHEVVATGVTDAGRRNVISGCSSTSRKSPERRWASRSSLPVVMLAASMVTSAPGRLRGRRRRG